MHRLTQDISAIHYLNWLAEHVARHTQPTADLISMWLSALHFVGFPIESIENVDEAQMVAILYWAI